MPIQSEKNYTISLLRFVAMLFIVLCHYFQYYYHELAWWFNVGVQMFFCISGFLYAKKRIASPLRFIAKGFRKILVPYYCYLIPTFVFYALFQPHHLSVKNVLGTLLTIDTIRGVEHLWFIFYILLCYLITPLLQRIADRLLSLKWHAFLGAFSAAVISGVFVSQALHSHIFYSRLVCYLFGYFASVFSDHYKESIFKTLTCLLAAAALALNMLKVYLLYIHPGSFNGNTAFSSYAHSLLGISIVLVSLCLITKLKKNRLLDLSDRYSFHVYLVHHLYILGPFCFMTLSSVAALNWAVTVFLILVSALLLKTVSGYADRHFDRAFQFFKAKTHS